MIIAKEKTKFCSNAFYKYIFNDFEESIRGRNYVSARLAFLRTLEISMIHRRCSVQMKEHMLVS